MCMWVCMCQDTYYSSFSVPHKNAVGVRVGNGNIYGVYKFSLSVHIEFAVMGNVFFQDVTNMFHVPF